MKKLFNKKVGAIVGTAVIATGLLALPALADTKNNSNANLFGQMQSFMSQTFSPGQHQQVMNSPAMQNLHNSAPMQQAMQSGDVSKMQELMNSDPKIKAQLGQDTLNKMNQFMSQNKDAMDQAMTNQNRGTMNQFMKDNGQAQHQKRQSGVSASGMMGSSIR